MPKGSTVYNAIYIGIGLVILLVMASSMILPQMNKAYQYCQNAGWKCDQAGTQANCTSLMFIRNETRVGAVGSTYTSAIGTHDVDDVNCASMCLNCDTAGGYRATNQGLVALILVLSLITVGFYFFWKK